MNPYLPRFLIFNIGQKEIKIKTLYFYAAMAALGCLAILVSDRLVAILIYGLSLIAIINLIGRRLDMLKMSLTASCIDQIKEWTFQVFSLVFFLCDCLLGEAPSILFYLNVNR